MTRPRKDHWERCDKCGVCQLILHRPTKLHETTYVLYGCRVCHYRWHRKVVVNSIYKHLKKGFVCIKDKKYSDWEDAQKLFLTIYRSTDVIFLQECYLEAYRRFETHFNRMWEKNLR